MGSKLYNGFQKLGKVLMAPVLLLPISGILVGLGSALSNANLMELVPFLASEPMVIFSTLIKAAGNVVNNHISVLFAICVAYGYARAEKATAALSGFIGYMTMNTIMGQLLTLLGVIDPENLLTGQSSILGVVTLDTGVFGGIAVGLIVSWLHNRYYKIQLPPVLGIFNGTRFIPAITIIVASLLGCVLSVVWPPVQNALSMMSTFIDSTGVFGAFIYGLSERLLLPFGLHHFIYLPFFFTSLGGTLTVDGQTVEGAVNIYNAILNTPGMMYDIDISKYVMNGKVLFAMFGLTGAALAIWRSSMPKNRKKTASLMIGGHPGCLHGYHRAARVLVPVRGAGAVRHPCVPVRPGLRAHLPCAVQCPRTLRIRRPVPVVDLQRHHECRQGIQLVLAHSARYRVLRPVLCAVPHLHQEVRLQDARS